MGRGRRSVRCRYAPLRVGPEESSSTGSTRVRPTRMAGLPSCFRSGPGTCRCARSAPLARPVRVTNVEVTESGCSVERTAPSEVSATFVLKPGSEPLSAARVVLAEPEWAAAVLGWRPPFGCMADPDPLPGFPIEHRVLPEEDGPIVMQGLRPGPLSTPGAGDRVRDRAAMARRRAGRRALLRPAASDRGRVSPMHPLPGAPEMRSPRRMPLTLVLALACLGSPTASQVAGERRVVPTRVEVGKTSALVVRVVDEEGAALPGATVARGVGRGRSDAGLPHRRRRKRAPRGGDRRGRRRARRRCARGVPSARVVRRRRGDPRGPAPRRRPLRRRPRPGDRRAARRRGALRVASGVRRLLRGRPHADRRAGSLRAHRAWRCAARGVAHRQRARLDASGVHRAGDAGAPRRLLLAARRARRGTRARWGDARAARGCAAPGARLPGARRGGRRGGDPRAPRARRRARGGVRRACRSRRPPARRPAGGRGCARRAPRPARRDDRGQRRGSRRTPDRGAPGSTPSSAGPTRTSALRARRGPVPRSSSSAQHRRAPPATGASASKPLRASAGRSAPAPPASIPGATTSRPARRAPAPLFERCCSREPRWLRGRCAGACS